MNKRLMLTGFLILMLSGCGIFSFYEDKPQGQVVFHWSRENTGIQKFSSDHSECMREAEPTKFLPDFSSWFYSEAAKLNIRADWHAGKGIWASYVPYTGAQPIMVNSIREDSEVSPRTYRKCMEARGYWHRTANIPEITNLYVYKPQRVLQNKPFDDAPL